MITELFVVLIVCSIANFQDMLSCFQLFMIESHSGVFSAKTFQKDKFGMQKTLDFSIFFL